MGYLTRERRRRYRCGTGKPTARNRSVAEAWLVADPFTDGLPLYRSPAGRFSSAPARSLLRRTLARRAFVLHGTSASRRDPARAARGHRGTRAVPLRFHF